MISNNQPATNTTKTKQSTLKIIQDKLYLSFEQCEQAGLSPTTMGRWEEPLKVADPADGRKKLIRYDLLKPINQRLITNTYGNPHTYFGFQALETLLIKDKNAQKQLDLFQVNEQYLSEDLKKKYSNACDLLKLTINITTEEIKATGFPTIKAFYDLILLYIKENSSKFPNKFPASYRNYKQKERDFKAQGIKAVVSGYLGNEKAKKIDEKIADWLIAKYAIMTKIDTVELTNIYNSRCQKIGWPTLSRSAIYSFLHKTDIEPIWWLGRHGVASWKKRFEHHMKLFLPTYRDAMWCFDGTKLNFYYRDEDSSIKMNSKLKINKVTDVFSEVILGYDLAFSEDHVSTYLAIKEAVKFSGHRPFQVLYDGQAGNTKAETQDFLDRISQVHFKAKPYNAQSKPVESIIGRFQKKVMKKYWFFTGQNVTAKSEDSKANIEYILAHKDDLWTIEEVRALVPMLIKEWNNSPHPLYPDKTRLEVYLESINPEATPVDYLDMVDMFWLTKQLPITYKKGGIMVHIGKNKHEFEVYEEDKVTPKQAFYERYINAKFIVKYDLEDPSHVRLFELYGKSDLRFVDVAWNKNEVARFVGDLTPGMREDIDKCLSFRKGQKLRAADKLKKAQANSGVDPEALLSVGYLNPNKNEMNDAEDAMAEFDVTQYM